MKTRTVIWIGLITCIGALQSGCIPYVVGSTARPASVGITQQTISVYTLPHTLELGKSPESQVQPGMDVEIRHGISDRADVGLRTPAGTGLIVSYKRRLDGPTNKRGAAVAVMVGGGAINYFRHAEAEATLLVSGQDATFTPYGGLRGVYTLPIGYNTRWDDPVFGGFSGLRIGSASWGISAEVGVFRDSNQFKKFGRDIIIVPSITVHTDVIGAFNRLQNRVRN